ncbi:MAG: cytochrome C [Pseudomonadota bacterium]
MIVTRYVAAFLGVVLMVATSHANEHEGTEYIQENGYQGPKTCEECHPGTAKAFLETVHWKHASKVDHVDNLKAGQEYGMKNRIYTMCNANDIVNNLKEIPPNEAGKTKFSGCNTCHPGDHSVDVGSTGPEAEQAIDCLICHSSKYDFSKRKPVKDKDGKIIMTQDRSTEAALNIGRPTTKNCMVCHESAGGGALFKRGFSMTKDADVHAAKGLVCVDCHKVKNHRFPTGKDPNNWATDGEYMTCSDCHSDKPHKDDDYNRHTAYVACQTCHIPRTGGAFAKDFTKWTKTSSGFYEPSTLKKEVNETAPVYAWYNLTVSNTPHFIGPKGSRTDGKSKIYPFKVYQGKAYYNKVDGQLLAMDFAEPMATGDTLAGVTCAANTLGIKKVEPVPGWQTTYFGSNHQVAPKNKALTCANCHAINGILNFKALGYNDKEVEKLTSPAMYFDKVFKIQQENE